MKRKKLKIDERGELTSEKENVEFCLNCNDMDDLAVSPQADDTEAAKLRFRNCDDTGKFQGDVCSRLFVLDETTDPGPLFDED